jgi:hypothetical protein
MRPNFKYSSMAFAKERGSNPIFGGVLALFSSEQNFGKLEFTLEKT